MNANTALPSILGAATLIVLPGCKLKLVSPDYAGAEIDIPVGTHTVLIKNRGTAEWIELEIAAGEKGRTISWGLPTKRWKRERNNRLQAGKPLDFTITFNGKDYLNGPGD